MSNFCDFIHVFVFTTNHHKGLICSVLFCSAALHKSTRSSFGILTVICKAVTFLKIITFTFLFFLFFLEGCMSTPPGHVLYHFNNGEQLMGLPVCFLE